MPTVDDYIATLSPPDRGLFAGMSAAIKQFVPSVEQGVSYAMPAFLYKGKPLVSFIVRKKHYSLYPFSGKVIDKVQAEQAGFSCTSGSIHFTDDHPIGDSLLKEILEARIQEIDDLLASL